MPSSSAQQRGATAPTSPIPPCVYIDVNASSVIEQPRETPTFSVFDIFGRVRGRTSTSGIVPAPAHAHAEITAHDFLGFVSQLRAARRRLKLPEAEAAAADYAADLALADYDAGGGSDAGGALERSRREAPGAAPPRFSAAGTDAFQTVPSRFFDPMYDITAPGMFVDLLNSGLPLDDTQDLLAGYLDVVECQLLTSIQSRSHEFFEALKELQVLRERVMDGNRAAMQMRRQLERLKHKNCVQPLAMIAMHRRRRREAVVRDLLSLVQEVCAAPATASAAYSAGNLNAALDAIAGAQALARGHLSSLACLAAPRRRLDELESIIGQNLVERFSRTTVTLIVVGANSGVAVIDAAAEPSAAGSIQEALQTSVRPILEGLVRVRYLGEALDALQAGLTAELKEVVRSEVVEAVRAAEDAETPPGAASNASSEGGASAERLQALSPTAFLSVLNAVCKGLLEFMQRLQIVHELIEGMLDVSAVSGSDSGDARRASSGVASTAASRWSSIDSCLGLSTTPASVSNSAASATVAAERQVQVQRWRASASGVLAVAMDVAQRHVARLLGTRREQSLRLRILDLRRLVDTATEFSCAASGILTRSSAVAALSQSTMTATGVVWEECLSQVHAHLTHVHERNTLTLGELLDVEQWKQADVPHQVQAVADAIIAAVSVAPSSSSFASPGTILLATEGIDAKTSLLHSNQRDSSRVLLIAGTTFPFVASGVMLIKMLGDYSSIAEAFSEATAEAIACTVQLLRFFNTRSTALVLGAGALQTAQLKRITAKHLALTSQTLGGLLALLPALRALLLIRLPPHQHVLLSELAAVTADLIAHDNKIREKLVSIVKDLMAACCGNMGALPWGQSAVAFAIPSPPMVEFVSGVTTLHRILQGTLRSEQLAEVFSRILLMANAHLPSQYATLIAKLATAAAAAAVALASPPAGSAASPAQFSFDRTVAVQRMGSDLRVLLQQLELLCMETRAPFAALTALAGSTADGAAACATADEALSALNRWIAREFSSASVSPAADAPVIANLAGDGDGEGAEDGIAIDIDGEDVDVDGGVEAAPLDAAQAAQAPST